MDAMRGGDRLSSGVPVIWLIRAIHGHDAPDILELADRFGVAPTEIEAVLDRYRRDAERAGAGED